MWSGRFRIPKKLWRNVSLVHLFPHSVDSNSTILEASCDSIHMQTVLQFANFTSIILRITKVPLTWTDIKKHLYKNLISIISDNWWTITDIKREELRNLSANEINLRNCVQYSIANVLEQQQKSWKCVSFQSCYTDLFNLVILIIPIFDWNMNLR